MGKAQKYHNEIVQIRADATMLNQRMLELMLQGVARRDIGVASIRVGYASDYEFDMFRVWYLLARKCGYQRYFVEEVDRALIASDIAANGEVAILYEHLCRRETTPLTKRFYAELQGAKLRVSQ